MNNKNYIFFSIFVLLFFTSCEQNNDYVFKEFSWLITAKNFLAQPVLYEKNWYLVYDLTIEQINDILRNNFENYNYQGWHRYNGSCSIGNDKSIQINGYRNHVMINLKNGSDSYNKIAIFIDVTEKKIILFYGITYGM